MNLFGKIAIATIAVIFVFGVIFGALLLFYHPVSKPLTSTQAEALVLKDIQQEYPNAVFSVISISKSNLTADSWNVVLNIVYNSTKPCPEVMTEGFDYPAVTLVPSDEVLYSSDCKVYGFGYAPDYVISQPYIAITRAYESGNPQILDYIGRYGYNNTNAYASYYKNGNSFLYSIGINSTDAWIIKYNSTKTANVLYAEMGTNGTVLATSMVNASNYTYAIN
ncbi:MAG: hypothetical protein QW814_01055 [Methanothrix sp.]